MCTVNHHKEFAYSSRSLMEDSVTTITQAFSLHKNIETAAAQPGDHIARHNNERRCTLYGITPESVDTTSGAIKKVVSEVETYHQILCYMRLESLISVASDWGDALPVRRLNRTG